jgi:hypothetical protein
MNHAFLLSTFVALSVAEFALFGMQRTTLRMSKEADVPSRVGALLLPRWFPAVWIVTIGKWASLIAIGYSWNWLIAGGLVGAGILLSAVLPIPYRAYVPGFRKRIARIREKDGQAAATLEAMLNSSKLPGR